MDVFEVNAVDLINVTQVIVGHNDKEAGRGWFLRRICVRVADDSTDRYWMFPCDRYVASPLDCNCNCTCSWIIFII